MKFNGDNKVLVDTLDVTEAKAFIIFLEEEITRHKNAIKSARMKGDEGNPWDEKEWRARRRFYDTAIDRHKQDIKETKKKIEQVRKLQEGK